MCVLREFDSKGHAEKWMVLEGPELDNTIEFHAALGQKVTLKDLKDDKEFYFLFKEADTGQYHVVTEEVVLEELKDELIRLKNKQGLLILYGWPLQCESNGVYYKETFKLVESE